MWRKSTQAPRSPRNRGSSNRNSRPSYTFSSASWSSTRNVWLINREGTEYVHRLTRIKLWELTPGAYSLYSASRPAGSGRIQANSSAKRFWRLALAARNTPTTNRS